MVNLFLLCFHVCFSSSSFPYNSSSDARSGRRINLVDIDGGGGVRMKIKLKTQQVELTVPSISLITQSEGNNSQPIGLG